MRYKNNEIDPNKTIHSVVDTQTKEIQSMPLEGGGSVEYFDDKVEAKGFRNRLNDKHNGWPTDKEGKRIPDAMPRFVVSKVLI